MVRDDLEAVVDGGTAAAALAEYLPVFEPGVPMFDACSDPAVDPPGLIADDAAGRVAPRCGDGGDAAVAAVAEVDQRAQHAGWKR
jgi:hypothetical protein